MMMLGEFCCSCNVLLGPMRERPIQEEIRGKIASFNGQPSSEQTCIVITPNDPLAFRFELTICSTCRDIWNNEKKDDVLEHVRKTLYSMHKADLAFKKEKNKSNARP